MWSSVSVHARSAGFTPNKETKLNLGILASVAVGLVLYQRADEKTSNKEGE